MVRQAKPKDYDLVMRASGAAGVLVGGLAVVRVYQLVNAAPKHGATVWELLLAALAYLGICLGSALVALGRHVQDQVAISPRWAERDPIDGDIAPETPLAPQATHQRDPYPFARIALAA